MIYISYAREDQVFALWLSTELQKEGLAVYLDIENVFVGSKWEQEIEQAVSESESVIVLVSPDGASSMSVLQEVNLARRHDRPLFPIVVRHTEPPPWYLQDLPMADFTSGRDAALQRFLSRNLRQQDIGSTLGEARDIYLNRATLKSAHTVDSYSRAIDLFFSFLSDRSTTSTLPIQKTHYFSLEEIPLSVLAEDDAPIFLHFVQWLISPGAGKKGDKRPYKPSTVELRLAGVLNWFQFLDDHGWLPPSFKLAKATRIVRDELRARPAHAGPPRPPEHIEEVIYYYDSLELPKHLRKPDIAQDRIRRWELTQLRNRALLHALAETGGRISELLGLNLDDFPERYLHQQEVLRIEVMGKGGHTYYLRFFDALHPIRDYIHARGSDLRATPQGKVPLFVSHDPRYDGTRMSRIVAWRIVQRAARALGLRHITPHDFRHWRATQLINAGHSLDVVQDYLGHRSVETTRAYYAHTDPLRVDNAARHTRLPSPQEGPVD